jgi:hypothetical protein
MTTVPAPNLAEQGGAGGGRPPFRQMELARGVRQRRLERMVARARLRIARASAGAAESDTEASLQALREGLAAKVVVERNGVRVEHPDPRERRQSAEALLHHHREVAKGLKADDAPDPATGPRVLVIAPDDLRRLLAAPGGTGDVVAALAGLATPAPTEAGPGSEGGR